MQDGTVWILLGICGLGILLVGLIIFLAVTVLRFSGGGILGLFNVFARGAKDDEEKSLIPQSPRPDLRALARAESFDTALTNQVVQHDLSAQIAPPPAQNPAGYSGVPSPYAPPLSPSGTPPSYNAPALPGYQVPIPPLPPYEPPTHRRSTPNVDPAPRRGYEGDDMDVGGLLEE